MKLKDRIEILSNLGDRISRRDLWQDTIMEAYANNPWFTPKNINKSLDSIASNFLNKEKLNQWTSSYSMDSVRVKKVGLIPAGNIPLVGFHDILSVLVSGHQLIIKPSEKDKILTKRILDELIAIDPAMADYIHVVDKMIGHEAVIATGSDNSARYFYSYFKHIPHIIRKNRNSVAVLSGNESKEQLSALGHDIFTYFGMGCRNVSKVYVPAGYDLTNLLESLHEYDKDVIHHHKYFNNFEYNIALFLLNKTPYLNNGSLILTKSDSLHSRIACLHYENYEDIDQLHTKLIPEINDIQCIACNESLKDLPVIPFGNTQSPELWDYADGVDTLKFLSEI